MTNKQGWPASLEETIAAYSEANTANADCPATGSTETAVSTVATAAKMENELLAALIDLQKQIHAHYKMNVRKDYSLMVADAQASKAIANAKALKH